MKGGALRLALMGLGALGVLGALGGCRTEVRPLVKAAPVRVSASERLAECIVNDYRSALDVPAGSINLGWVVVAREATDEETLEKLRQAVCAKGGTALSQARWNRPAGASVADPPAELEANAWVEP